MRNKTISSYRSFVNENSRNSRRNSESFQSKYIGNFSIDRDTEKQIRDHLGRIFILYVKNVIKNLNLELDNKKDDVGLPDYGELNYRQAKAKLTALMQKFSRVQASNYDRIQEILLLNDDFLSELSDALYADRRYITLSIRYGYENIINNDFIQLDY